MSSQGNHEIGYGKPPKHTRFVKGQSGNPAGRRKAPRATWAMKVEEAWMTVIPVEGRGITREVTAFELIVLQLLIKMSEGSRKAHRIFRKYEAYAKTRPAKRRDRRPQGLLYSADIYARSLNGEQGHASPKQATPVMAKARLALKARIERMKRGQETPTIMEGMNAKQSMEVYSLCLNMVPEPPKLRVRKRKGKLEASEIFSRVINDPVSLSEGTGKFTGPRMMATIKRLLAKSVKGDLSSADTLVEIYNHALRYGDFYVKLELI